jgi:hypothetical protein
MVTPAAMEARRILRLVSIGSSPLCASLLLILRFGTTVDDRQRMRPRIIGTFRQAIASQVSSECPKADRTGQAGMRQLFIAFV